MKEDEFMEKILKLNPEPGVINYSRLLELRLQGYSNEKIEWMVDLALKGGAKYEPVGQSKSYAVDTRFNGGPRGMGKR
jgi:hypothetical protein